MKKLIISIILIVVTESVMAQSLSSFFSASDAFFKKYVKNGLVNYKAIKDDFHEIEYIYQQSGKMNLAAASSAEKQAFYINAYNLIVIYQVARYYPLKSPLDQSGFFDKVKHQVAGENMTLNYLEIKKLLFNYKDPRFHFALACAAQSCPPLASFAYTPANLDNMLTARTKLALNDNSWLRIDKQNKKVLLSKIFDWYNKDFTQNGQQTIISFINKYRISPIPSAYTIDYYEYNWKLNEMN